MLLIIGFATSCFNVAANAGSEQATQAAACRAELATNPSVYEQRLEQYPTSPELRLNFADALKCHHQWERAISQYQEVIRRWPDNTEAALGLDTVHRWREDFDQTMRSYEQEADAAARRWDFATAASAYEKLVEEYPASLALRHDFADALKGDRQWQRAVNEYGVVIENKPDNTEAILGLGTVHRWQGNLDEARRIYQQAHEMVPQKAEALLGLADTYALDHDYAEADKLYQQAQQMWPGDSSVQQAAYDFQRQRNLRLYLFWENDLSFETRQAGFIVPFAAREEIGAEYQQEISIAPALNDAKVYTRDDNKIFYTHYFGLDHTLDFSARSSEYQYHVPDSNLGYSAIDTYEEYRGRYTLPLTLEHVFSVRYAVRPTTLKLSQDSFNAHKLEGELNSRWTPRFSTLIGGGWLRDLDSNAISAEHLTERSLVKLGFQWDISNHFSLGAKRITNPDLDNSMNSTSIAEVSYSINDTWSTIGRYSTDDYKTSADQTNYYVAARFVPNSNWWSEIGLKYAERGDNHGIYGLASVSYRF